MRKYLYIGMFSFFGAIFRYIIKNAHIYHYNEVIPINTLIINVTGSFIIALVLTIAYEVWEMKEELRLGITTGFLGAYTTFSSLCKETYALLQKGLYFSALSYVTMSAILGLCAVYIGIILAREYVTKIVSREQKETAFDEENQK